MARGLGATRGSASSDSIVTSLTAHNAQRTYAWWAKFNSYSNFARVLEKWNAAASQMETLQYEDAVANFSFIRVFSGGTGRWSINAATLSTGVWAHYALVYDSSSASNDPQWYRQGATISQVEVNNPTSGTATTNSDAYTWGNRQSDLARVVDADFAEMAIWNALLTAGEIAALARGFSALRIRANSLVQYIPAVRDMIDLKNSGGVGGGGAVREHPPIMGVPSPIIGVPSAAASQQPPRSMHQFRLRRAA
jgi:hypothetical protein